MKRKNRFSFYIKYVVLIALAIVIAATEFFLDITYKDDNISALLKNTLVNFEGSLFFLILFLLFGSYNVFSEKPSKSSILIFLSYIPAVISNFPIIALIKGNAELVYSFPFVLLLFCDCLFIGIFEEWVFRGIVFPAILERRRDNSKDIFLSVIVSSAIFGVSHFFNLFSGESFFSCLLQAGYSILVGGMCSIILLKTKNIVFPIIAHTLFDFGGYFVGILCKGSQWDIISIVVCAILTVISFLASVYVLLKTKPCETDFLFEKRSVKFDDNQKA